MELRAFFISLTRSGVNLVLRSVITFKNMPGINRDFKMLNIICFCKIPNAFSQWMNRKCVGKLNSLFHQLIIYLCKVLTDIDFTFPNCCSMSHWCIQCICPKIQNFICMTSYLMICQQWSDIWIVKCRHLQQITIVGGNYNFQI
jgi:hypothetical protein